MKNKDINNNLDGVVETATLKKENLIHKYWARVILAEDNVVNQKIAESLLKKVNLKIDIASSGKDVLELLEQRNYDLIFMDLQMPVMDGFTATLKIREIEEYKDIPIVALTAHSTPEERARCIECGMDDFLSKPLEPKDLYDIVDKWILKNEREFSINAIDHDIGKSDEIETNFEQTYKDETEIFATIRKRFRGNFKFYQKMVSLFFETLDQHLDKIKNGITNNIPEDIKFGAHSVKGSAANLGIESLRAVADGLELNSQKLSIHELSIRFENLLLEIENFRAFSRNLPSA